VKQQTRIATFALSLALGSLGFAPMLQAQTQSQEQQSQKDDQKTQVMTGKIIKTKSGRFALLTDPENGKGVYLDDQEKAGQFEGKNVKVSGVLDASSNTMRVASIELA
jgi:hypothetical protein